MALAAGALVALAAGAVQAAGKPPASSAPVAQGPILDPRTGSYFELRIDNAGQRYWEDARRIAVTRRYKGRPGRLAVVADLDTLNFIRDRFRINEEVWIGLRFFCRFRKLLWVTGEIHPISENRLWAPQWFRNQSVRCMNQSNMMYMPVYLTAEGAGVTWQAAGQSKQFVSYLIEYPAPGGGVGGDAAKAPGEAKPGGGDGGTASPADGAKEP